MQNSARFQKTSEFDREYLRNGTRYPKSERDVITGDSCRVPRKKSGELSSTNYRELEFCDLCLLQTIYFMNCIENVVGIVVVSVVHFLRTKTFKSIALPVLCYQIISKNVDETM